MFNDLQLLRCNVFVPILHLGQLPATLRLTERIARARLQAAGTAACQDGCRFAEHSPLDSPRPFSLQNRVLSAVRSLLTRPSLVLLQ
jgi:hypothetical protein